MSIYIDSFEYLVYNQRSLKLKKLNIPMMTRGNKISLKRMMCHVIIYLYCYICIRDLYKPLLLFLVYGYWSEPNM